MALDCKLPGLVVLNQPRTGRIRQPDQGGSGQGSGEFPDPNRSGAFWFWFSDIPKKYCTFSFSRGLRLRRYGNSERESGKYNKNNDPCPQRTAWKITYYLRFLNYLL